MPVRRAEDNAYILATDASGTGDAIAIKGGEYAFTVDGSEGGSTISLQVQTPNEAWVDVSIYSGSAVKSTTLPYSQTGINLPAGNVRMAATGGTPSGLNASLYGLG